MGTLGSRLKELWAAISREGFATETEANATAEKLRRVLNHCPVCENGFSDHSYLLFATTVLGETEKPLVVELFTILKEHRWRDAQKFQAWESVRDNLEIYTLYCKTGAIALLMVRSPQELYESDSLIDCEVLSIEESQKLQAITEQSQWQPLQE